ncbi:MAG: 5'-3' exonuclease [Candidatus Dormibacteria bacterium]
MATEWLLVDGSSLIFRAFFGVPKTVISPSGMPVNGIRGFLDNLARFISEREPARLVVASDEDWRPQYRVDLLPSYKAHRTVEPTPPELEPQVPITWDILAAIGIPVVGLPGYEAEDIIASIVRAASGRVEVLSGDRDLFALVRDPDVVVLYPEGGGRVAVIDEAEIERRYGVPGRSYIDFAVLRGDPSDGLPGLRGIGPRKAADMLSRHRDIAGILAGVQLSPADADYLERALKVVTPRADADLSNLQASLPKLALDHDRLVALAREHGVVSAVERVMKALAAASAATAEGPGTRAG